MATINLIGGGRVAQTLGRLLVQGGQHTLSDVLTRHTATAQAAVAFIGAGRALSVPTQLAAADLWVLAVPDDQIQLTASLLAQLPVASQPAVVCHSSGALASNVLGPLALRGWATASAHCLLSFATPAMALGQFAGTPCALEGDAHAVQVLQGLFSGLGARCFTLDAQDKLLYHAGAVFATNFLPVLQDLAEQLWQHSGMPPHLAHDMRERLLSRSVHNIVTLGPAGALTGPAARGDTALINDQAAALEAWQLNAAEAYRALSTLATQLAAKKQAA